MDISNIKSAEELIDFFDIDDIQRQADIISLFKFIDKDSITTVNDLYRQIDRIIEKIIGEHMSNLLNYGISSDNKFDFAIYAVNSYNGLPNYIKKMYSVKRKTEDEILKVLSTTNIYNLRTFIFENDSKKIRELFSTCDRFKDVISFLNKRLSGINVDIIVESRYIQNGTFSDVMRLLNRFRTLESISDGFSIRKELMPIIEEEIDKKISDSDFESIFSDIIGYTNQETRLKKIIKISSQYPKIHEKILEKKAEEIRGQNIENIIFGRFDILDCLTEEDKENSIIQNAVTDFYNNLEERCREIMSENNAKYTSIYLSVIDFDNFEEGIYVAIDKNVSVSFNYNDITGLSEEDIDKIREEVRKNGILRNRFRYYIADVDIVYDKYELTIRIDSEANSDDESFSSLEYEVSELKKEEERYYREMYAEITNIIKKYNKDVYYEEEIIEEFNALKLGNLSIVEESEENEDGENLIEFISPVIFGINFSNDLSYFKLDFDVVRQTIFKIIEEKTKWIYKELLRRQPTFEFIGKETVDFSCDNFKKEISFVENGIVLKFGFGYENTNKNSVEKAKKFILAFDKVFFDVINSSKNEIISVLKKFTDENFVGLLKLDPSAYATISPEVINNNSDKINGEVKNYYLDEIKKVFYGNVKSFNATSYNSWRNSIYFDDINSHILKNKLFRNIFIGRIKEYIKENIYYEDAINKFIAEISKDAPSISKELVLYTNSIYRELSENIYDFSENVLNLDFSTTEKIDIINKVLVKNTGSKDYNKTRGLLFSFILGKNSRRALDLDSFFKNFPSSLCENSILEKMYEIYYSWGYDLNLNQDVENRKYNNCFGEYLKNKYEIIQKQVNALGQKDNQSNETQKN